MIARGRSVAVGRTTALLLLTGLAALTCGKSSSSSPAERAELQQPVTRGAASPAPDGPPPDGRPPNVHPTGLVIGPQPPAYAVRATAAGFRVEPANARQLRNPWSVQLRLADADPVNTSSFERKSFGDREVRHRVEVDEQAGSGGSAYTLTALIACGPKRIVMTAMQQAEPPARPDWSAAWTILASSRCQPPQR